jgi:PAS domain S-box-containing protein
VTRKTQVLLVEDDLAHAELISRAFEIKESQFDLTVVHNLQDAHKAVVAIMPNLVIVDFLLPDGRGIEFLPTASADPHYPIILMTSHGDEQVAVDAMKAGAADYVVKSEETLLGMPRIAERVLREWDNIAERKRAERALQESEQRFRSIIEQSTDGIMLTDEEGLVIEWNQAAERMTGLSRDDVVGQSNWEVQVQLVAPDTDAIPAELLQLKEELKAFYETGQSPWLNKAQDLHFQHKEGDKRIVEVLSFPIKSEHGFMAGSFLRDVTEARRTEEHIRQHDRLAAVGQLAAGIAHDFNNIMAVIVLYSQISLRAPELPDKVQERLQIVVQQANRAAELIEQILDFSRRTVLERRPLDLIPLLKAQVKLLSRTVPENIEIDMEFDRDNYSINADPTRIQQALMNLVLNARDAMSDGGMVRIKLQKLYLEEDKLPPIPQMSSGDWVCVCVSDTGSGIGNDVLPHLYEPFFTTKEPGKGTGLGLAQVYGIVKQHEGHIDVKSQVGIGTEFVLYFPALQIFQAENILAEITSLPLGQGESVLVVEDNEATREALVESLKLLNYEVEFAANGRLALDYLDQVDIPPRLIVSDIIMPEMGGLAMSEILQQKGIHIPTLFISGHPLDNEPSDSIQDGLVEWLPKPPNLADLAELVARMLKG